MKRFAVTGVVSALLLASSATFAATCGTTSVVTPATMDGWHIVISEPGMAPETNVQFVSGPGTPPAGAGSARLKVANGEGDGAAQLRNPEYAGVRLADLTELKYSTYVTANNGGQAVYLVLNVDWDNDGIVDDAIFFEPVYQTGGYSGDSVPDQCNGGGVQCVALNTWQTWDALQGGWWANEDQAGGPPLETIATYIAKHPDAKIVNTEVGGGLRLVAGFGSGAWDGFDGNADKLQVGVQGCHVTYNFEALTALTKDECKKGYDQQKKDFDEQQKADKKAFDATHPSPQAKKAFEEQQKADKKAFDKQNDADKKSCDALPKK